MPRQRGVMCARCHVQFPGFDRLRLLWCTVDRFYVCRRCWGRGCLEGHGKGAKAARKPTTIIAAALVLTVGLTVWWPAVAYDNAILSTWQGAPPVGVSSLVPGELAKVQGVIETLTFPGFGYIALGGHEMYRSGSGWEWDFNTTDTFRIRDLSGGVLVSTNLLYVVYNGLHPAPYAVHTDGTVYRDGDPAVIVGTVTVLPDGVRELQAQVIAYEQTSYGPNPAVAGLVILLPAIAAGVAGATATVFAVRHRRHRRAVAGAAPAPIESADTPPDAGLDWKPNRKGTRSRNRGAYASVAVLAGALLPAFFPGYRPLAFFGYWDLGLIGFAVITIEAPILGIFLIRIPPRPAKVAVGDDGFHLWYDSPYDRLLNDTVFPWDQVMDIRLTGGRAPHWVLVWTTGEKDDLTMLSGQNLRLLREEWRRRIASMAPSASEEASPPPAPRLPEFRL